MRTLGYPLKLKDVREDLEGGGVGGERREENAASSVSADAAEIAEGGLGTEEEESDR